MKTYTVKQIADILGYSTKAVDTLLKEGKIKAIPLGRGRFGISESLLPRILDSSKAKANNTDLVEESINSSPKSEANLKKSSDPVKSYTSVWKDHTDLSGVFDWFISVASVVLGFALFLYSKFHEGQNVYLIQEWQMVVQIELIVGGIGLIFTNLLQRDLVRSWHKVFHIIVSIAFVSLSLLRWFAGDLAGGATFGAIGLISLGKTVFNLPGIHCFLFFMIIESILPAVMALVDQTQLVLMKSGQLNFMTEPLYVGLWILTVVILGVVLLWSHSRKRKVYWLLLLLYGVIFISSAFAFISDLDLSKAFFMLIVGLTAILVSVWEYLFWAKQKEGSGKIIPLFLSILVFLVFFLGIIWFMEQNIKEYVGNELKVKSSHAAYEVSSTVEYISELINNTVGNDSFMSAVSEKKQEEITRLLKLTFNPDKKIRRMLLLDENGNLISIYPHIALTQSNFAFRDYFKKPLESHKIYLSDIFETATREKIRSITLSNTVINKDGQVIGVLAASLNFDYLNKSLQETVDSDAKEYVSIVDKKGQPIILPSEFETYNQSRVHFLQSDKKISGTQWRALVRVPFAKVFQPTQTVSKTLFFILVFIIALSGLYLVLKEKQ